MAKTKKQKKQIINDLAEKIKKSKSVIFINFNKLGVKDNENLRKELRKENNEYYVAKKTLMNLAIKNIGIKDIEAKKFNGKAAIIFGYGDEVSPAKIISQFQKNAEDKIEFIGGILENAFIKAETVSELAKLPSKTELYAKIVGSINAPVSGFVNALAGNLRNLVYILKAVEESKNN